MSTNHFPRKQTKKTWFRPAHTKPTTSTNDWRCTECGILIGVYREGRLHLRYGRNHEYLVSLPAQAACRDCGTLNDARSPGSG